jgi:hypothetical protein
VSGRSLDLLRIAKAEYTPGARDFAALFALLGGDDAAAALIAERALARAGAKLIAAAQERLTNDAAAPALRAGFARVAARVGGAPALALAIALLADGDSRVRRAAAQALGKLGKPEPHERDGAEAAEAALVAAWSRAVSGAEKRTIAEALGKVGGAAAMRLLASAAPDADAKLAGTVERARLVLSRDQARVEPSRVSLGAASPQATVVRLHAREGLEAILGEELGAIRGVAGVTPTGPGVVEVRLAAGTAPAALFGARTWIDLGFPVGERAGADADPVAAAVALLGSPGARALLGRFTTGPRRFRVAWVGKGHRRADTWRLAAALAQAAPDLINDPRDAPWEARLDHERGRVALTLVPRKLDDPRFAWRRADVPAASHPTIAAALAHVADPRPIDVVWDPFAGSGSELIECARLGAGATLIGCDTDARAIAAAEQNLAAAGLTATLAAADALVFRPPRRPTLVVTNPPMGRRVHRGDVGPLLARFVTWAGEVLAPGGRLAWLTPTPRSTDPAAARAGFRLGRQCDVDLGGFSARLQRLERSR